ncbi:MAG: trypsin-like peptidase domain-containing protein, partial [Acidimicrobiales bacterium]|nr:trypsin-like peptidase domain-containing protein [Acidimicrobiales bacterium]
MEDDQTHQRRSVDRRSIEVGGHRPVEPTFPGLLPAPVPPIEPPVRISGRLLAGLFAVAVLVAALVAGAVAGWMLRGEDGDAASSVPLEIRSEEATGTVLATGGLSEAEVTALVEGVLAAEGLSAAQVTTLVEAVLASEGLSEAEVTVLVEAVVADEGLSEAEVTALVEGILSEREGLSAADVEVIVADRLSEAPGLSTDDVASIAASVVEESAGLSAEEVETVVGRLIEESAGLTAEEVELLVARLFAEAPVDDSGDEPVVAVAEALVDSVVLVSVPETSHGSGIVFDDGGRIVTNAHVVDDADEVVVSLPNGRQIVAEVVGFDVRRDVAVLQLTEPDSSLVPAVFAFTEDIHVGQLAVALGSPFDLDRTVTAGIVSAVGRVINSYGCHPDQVDGGVECAGVSMIQTDAPINPGNSGGPLADREGRVIGMNTAIHSTGLTIGNIGVGFAIPSDTVVLVARRLILGEPIGTAWLGIRGESTIDGRPGALIV